VAVDSVAAKQFLISKVVEEAVFEHVLLSDVERKMLYFTEVHASLPDIYEVNAEFERSYNQDEYESKVAALLRNARDRDRKESPGQDQSWKDALAALRKEDHYILVMVGRAFGPGSSAGKSNRLRDFAIYVAIGIGVVLTLFLLALWRSGP
jgi:hypothetical protein